MRLLRLDPQGAQDGKESRGLHQAAGRGWSSEPQPTSWACPRAAWREYHGFL
uniref:Uncharacterized protein n=1 Tax=uncultured gamma proteobacterium HF0010_01E20 TaxID=710977 RepID=E0XQ71_9GAMM|nr:hypothetical protein [uncultured gamma proteobacterium HF0010_01E20]